VVEKNNENDKVQNDNSDLLREISMLVGGKNAGPIVNLLTGRKHVNEFIVAKKLELTINQTRNILYKLADDGLVSSIRKKDKKKGWYTYFWIFNIDKALGLLQKNILNEISQLEHQLNSREVKQFYVCNTCKSELTEESALLQDFTCPECGEIYELKDNTSIILEIKSHVFRLKKKIEIVVLELKEIEEKRVKKVEREKKKMEKEKAEKRRKAAELRRKIAKKKVKKVKKTKKKIKKTKKKINKAKKKIKKKSKKKVVKKSKKVVKKTKKTKNKKKQKKDGKNKKRK